MPTAGVLYFGLFNPSITLPYPFTSHPLTSFNTHPYILYIHVLCYVILLITILFSFPSFPEFHGVVPLLRTCSTSEFVYDHVCFCVYVYL
jgi:hypothetical protein